MNSTNSTLEPVANSNSKQLITDFYSQPYISYSSNSIIPQPDFVPSEAFKVIQNDPIVKAAIITKVDRTLISGWRISGMNDKSRKEDLEENLDEVHFARVLRKALFHAYLYNNAFIEIVKTNGKVTDLNVLEPSSIEILTHKNGDVIGYRQRDARNTDNNEQPFWNPEQIWHFKLNDIRNNVWAEFDIKAIYETVLLKDKVRQWLTWYFKTNQSKGMYNIKNASDKSIRDFLSYLKAAENDPSKPIILEGEIEHTIIRKFADEGASLIQLLEWCDSQILSLLQVPPIAIGKMDQSGRSNSSEAFSALDVSVYGVQELLEEDITYDLFPKMGFSKVEFEFGIIDHINEERIFKIIGMMKQAQFKDEVIVEWMDSQGLQFTTNDLFNPLPDPMNPNGGPQVQYDNAPSRQRKSSDVKSNSYNVSTTRDKQLIKNSFDTNLSPDPKWVL